MNTTVNVKSLGECPYLISLEPHHLIGRGTFAQVRIAFDRTQPQVKLAAKIFELDDSSKFASAFKELGVVSKIPKHPSLVEYKKVKITSKNRLYIIMELCQTSLSAQIKRKHEEGTMDEKYVWSFLREFAEGYKMLEGRKILHRDIKPDNILIGQDGKFKIADFGLAEFLQEITGSTGLKRGSSQAKGTLCYLAPELLSKKHEKKCVSSLVDVYSLGVTVFYMCFLAYPYARDLSKYKTVSQFVGDILECPLIRPLQCPYSPKLMQLVESMLEKQPLKRCTWEYIFYTVMQVGEAEPIQHINERVSQGIDQKIKVDPQRFRFRVVEISDAFLKNLSALDADLYGSMANESLVVIDHVEAQILSKRQLIYYCDRLYYRIFNLTHKSSAKIRQGAQEILKRFGRLLLAGNSLRAAGLVKSFEEFYQKLEKSEFMKLVGTKKYSAIKELIHQDSRALAQELMEQAPLLAQQTADQLDIEVYSMCSAVICVLYEAGFYEECCQVHEVEKWLGGSSESILVRVRKNENAMREYEGKIGGISGSEVRKIISPEYLYRFNQLDKQRAGEQRNIMDHL